ncbi:MAG: isopenicillin N synthase family oxygenase [Gammaproteobacteria bacterium]|nr:isopenicillin N synthase family oxygenase [Gammaproteobacteria bacterium]
MSLPQSRRLDFDEIPIIDIGQLLSGSPAPELVQKIDRTCRNIGFFYIVGHGFDMGLAERLQSAASEYFSQAESNKLEIGLDPSMRGYLSLYYRSQITDSFSGTSHQEGFWMGHEFDGDIRHPLEQNNRWPQEPARLRTEMTRYHEAIEKLAAPLGQCFADALGQAEDFYLTRFARPTSRLKLNHYPPQENPQRIDNIGVIPHSDSGAFTILWQDDNGGLEVQSKSGEWVVAPPVDDSFVVNIGDILQYWSNGRYSSTQHRVINRYGVDRYSIPYFVNPGAEVMISALDSSDSFTAFNYGEYQLNKWKSFFPVDETLQE